MRRQNELAKDLISTDPVIVKKAIEKLSPEAILKDLESPEPPPWVEAFEDWVDVAMPSAIFKRWSAHQGDHSDDNWYYEYDWINERLGIRSFRPATHSSATQAFWAQTWHEIGRLSRSLQDQLRLGHRRQFSGFDFPYVPLTMVKEPDAYLSLRGRDFPLVVLEAGWAEREQDLVKNAQLWLHGTFDQVKFAIIIIFAESKDLRLQQGVDEIPSTEGGVEGQLANGTAIELDGEDDSKTSNDYIRELARKLQDLEKDSMLAKPLLGALEGRLCLYRRCRENDHEMGIKSSDNYHQESLKVILAKEVKIFPKADPDITLPWREVLANEAKDVPDDDLKKTLTLSLKRFQVEIEEAILHKTRNRALTRAALILERRGKIDPGPTFSLLKGEFGHWGVDYTPSKADGVQTKKRKTC